MIGKLASSLVASFVLLAATGCSDPGPDRIEVFAAASLSAAFEDLAERFEQSEGAEVRLSLAASSDLARSIVDGSPADVFAAADSETMSTVIAARVVSGAEIFALNELAIAVDQGNPLGIDDLRDLVGVSVALCAPEVPCGAYAADALAKAGVDVEPDSLEPDVKAVVSRIALGEIDAGIVYATDVLGADVDGVSIPDEHNVIASYEMALIDEDNAVAAAFYELVLSEEGRQVLESYGFGSP